MARPITLEELQAWITKNEHHTWHSTVANLTNREKTLFIKYMRFNLDTRDMKIFAIHSDGFSTDLNVDFRDDKKDWTILDLLDSKIEAAMLKLGELK
jgi:hypothetical protein